MINSADVHTFQCVLFIVFYLKKSKDSNCFSFEKKKYYSSMGSVDL